MHTQRDGTDNADITRRYWVDIKTYNFHKKNKKKNRQTNKQKWPADAIKLLINFVSTIVHTSELRNQTWRRFLKLRQNRKSWELKRSVIAISFKTKLPWQYENTLSINSKRVVSMTRVKISELQNTYQISKLVNLKCYTLLNNHGKTKMWMF